MARRSILIQWKQGSHQYFNLFILEIEKWSQGIQVWTQNPLESEGNFLRQRGVCENEKYNTNIYNPPDMEAFLTPHRMDGKLPAHKHLLLSNKASAGQKSDHFPACQLPPTPLDSLCQTPLWDQKQLYVMRRTGQRQRGFSPTWVWFTPWNKPAQHLNWLFIHCLSAVGCAYH